MLFIYSRIGLTFEIFSLLLGRRSIKSAMVYAVLTAKDLQDLHDKLPPRGAKTEIVMQTINNQIGEFSISDIEKLCPGISRDMIRVVFRQLQKDKKVTCLGKGKSAKWKRIG